MAILKNAFKLFFIYLCLYKIFELSWAPLAFCRPCSLFRIPLRPRTAIFVDCWMVQHCWGVFLMERKIPVWVWVVWVFLLVWFWFGFGVFCGFWLELSTISCLFSLGILVDHGDYPELLWPHLKAPGTDLHLIYLSSVWSSV